MVISLDAEKALDKNPTSINEKISGETEDTKDIPQHDKGSLQYTHT